MKPVMVIFTCMVLTTSPVSAQTGGRVEEFYAVDSISRILPVESGTWAATSNGIVYWNLADGSHRMYTTHDGLPSDQCNAIKLAPDGSIWAVVGRTHIVRYDGSSWNVILDDTPMSGDYINDVQFDNNGDPWVWTGYRVYRQIDDEWRRYTEDDGLAGYPSGMFIGPDGDVWLTHLTGCIDNCVTSGNGVSHFDGEKWEIFNTHNGLLDNRTVGVGFSDDGRAWVLSMAGFSVYDGSSWVSDDTFGFGGVGEFACLSDGTVFVAKSAGIYRLKNNQWSMYTRPDISITSAVSAIFADSDDRLWVGSADGLSMLDGSEWVIRATERNWGARGFRGITQGPDGKIWAGSSSGLCSWDGDTFEIYNTGGPAGLPRDVEEIAYAGQTGDIWIINGTIAHYDGINWGRLTSDDGLPHTGLYCIDTDNSGNIWVGTHEGLLLYDGDSFRNYTADDGLKENWITTIGARAPDDVWIGYEHTGAAHFDGMSWTNYESTDEFPMNYLLSVDFDSAGNPWIAANIGILYNHDEEWTIWTPDDGLPESWADIIAVGDPGQAWASIDWRLAYLNGDAWEFYETSPGEYIGGIQNRITGLDIAEDGTVWCGTTDGIIHRIKDNDYDTFDLEALTGIAGLVARIIDPGKERIVAIGPSQVAIYSWGAGTIVSESGTVPAQVVLHPNYPNPFNPSTTIEFTLPAESPVTVSIFNTLGQRVARLHDGVLDAGRHRVVWDASGFGPGLYFYRVETNVGMKTGKMMLVK